MSEEKTYTCQKCGKVKQESKGSYDKEEKKFCCEKCCGKAEDKSQVCEFC